MLWNDSSRVWSCDSDFDEKKSSDFWVIFGEISGEDSGSYEG
jgi:hypothetical protein